MSKRFISLKTISVEKLERRRTWFEDRMKDSNNPFPKPVIRGIGQGRNLWDADEVDRWIEEFAQRERERSGGVERAA